MERRLDCTKRPGRGLSVGPPKEWQHPFGGFILIILNLFNHEGSLGQRLMLGGPSFSKGV